MTRDVEPSALRRVLDDPRRATVAFVERDAVELLPVRSRVRDGEHLFGVIANGAPDLDGSEVVLVMDDGGYWFDLCGVSARGVATHVRPPAQDASGRLRWYAVNPRRVLAWDYDTIREE